MKFSFFIVPALFGLSACARQPTQIAAPFDENTHRPYLAQGAATIAGQGFMRQQGGGTVTCAGSPVYLLPATAFFDEAIKIFKSGGTPSSAERLDPEFKPIVKQTQCDAQGNFKFSNVAPAQWTVITRVAWKAGIYDEGGFVAKKIDVGVDSQDSVYLTNDDLLR